MKIPISWICEYLNIKDVDTDEFMAKLTMIGQKVEGVTKTAEQVEKVVAGKVLEIKKHEGSDKLYIVSVCVNKGEPITIVTGAENVFAGAYVPVALCGATVYGADGEIKKIEEGVLRGVTSYGMLCSVEELGFSRHEFPEAPENGIYIIDEALDFVIGDDIRDVLLLRENVVEFEITSNRADCFSVFGLAREAAAAFGLCAGYPETATWENTEDLGIGVSIEDAELCPRYAARIVRDVKVLESPLWLRRRLADAGVRPINNIVDITNYVMLETGQPMHAFDLSCIKGGITVRRAKDGEGFTTLDEVKRTLNSDTLVITDDEKTLAVAGVMGGLHGSIAEDGATTSVLLEAACFDKTSVRLTSKRLGLRTEASGRFEKGLDPNLVTLALNRAAYLIESLGAGKSVRGIADCYPNAEKLSARRSIQFDAEEINNLLGVKISFEEMRNFVLPFEIELDEARSLAIIPTFRGDVLCAADLAEEVARAYGYDNIKPELFGGSATIGRKTKRQLLVDTIRDSMVAFGFCEAMTFSFEAPSVMDKLLVPAESPLRNGVKLLNPLGEGYSVMRTSAVGGMLQSLRNNAAKRADRVLLFEIGSIYFDDKGDEITGLPSQRSVVCAGMYGNGVDFYTAKGFAEELVCSVFGIAGVEFSADATSVSWLHPGRAAGIYVNYADHDGGACTEKIGYLGELHPDCAESFELDALGANKRVYLFELDVDALCKHANTLKSYREIPKFPAISRDFAFVVDDDITAGELLRSIRENGGELLMEASVFDVYKFDEALGKDKKSVAFSLVFRSQERTLSDAEVNPHTDKIVEALKNKYGAVLRS